MNGERLRVLIVDDEPLARGIIREMLQAHADIEIIGECSNGIEALTAIEERSPHLVFLDVQMPEMDGFGVLEAAGPVHLPAIIFVTAHDRYAVRAFEIHALDYLLKPFDEQRFNEALQRAKSQIAQQTEGHLNQQVKDLLEHMRANSVYLERLMIKIGGRVVFVKTEQIDWVDAEGNYARLHVGKEEYVIRQTVGSLEGQLDPKTFLRIHRSTIVNIDRVQELRPYFQGEHYVILRDGTQLTLSRRYQKRLQELLGRPL